MTPSVRVIPYTHQPAPLSLALEEAVFRCAMEQLKQTGWFDPIIRIYSFSKNSVILGYMQRIDEISTTYCASHNIDVTMRITGGGSVFLTPHDIQYSCILPYRYDHQMLKLVNTSITNALKEHQIYATLRTVNGQPVSRLPKQGIDKSFVFDAQRRASCITHQGQTAHAVWHHGTILVSTQGYEHMPQALKAPPRVIDAINYGNAWLGTLPTFIRNTCIKNLQQHLFQGKLYEQSYTDQEYLLAQDLLKSFYANPKAFSNGRKTYGVCYIPDAGVIMLPDQDITYDINKYVVEEQSTP